MKRAIMLCLLAAAACGDDAPAGPFAYHDPGPGKIRLLRSAASTSDLLVLDLVAAAPLRGWAVGFDLPLDGDRVALDATPLVPGRALSAGTAPAPRAAKAVIPSTGPLAGTLVAAQSATSGDDVALPAGTVLLSVRLVKRPGAPGGVVFDGAALDGRFRAGLLDKRGNVVVPASDFAMGKLTVR